MELDEDGEERVGSKKRKGKAFKSRYVYFPLTINSRQLVLTFFYFSYHSEFIEESDSDSNGDEPKEGGEDESDGNKSEPEAVGTEDEASGTPKKDEDNEEQEEED